jgi:hypothetical protein
MATATPPEWISPLDGVISNGVIKISLLAVKEIVS